MGRPGLGIHPKFKRLCAILREPRPHVRGYLELIWEVAYEAGNPMIGDAAMIEAAAEWPGEFGVLCNALLECGGSQKAGFIEEIPEKEEVYQIHDLFDHCPDYVKKRRQRESERQERNKADNNFQRQPTADNGSQRRTSAVNGKQHPAITDNGTPPAPAPAPAPAPSDETRRDDHIDLDFIENARARANEISKFVRVKKSNEVNDRSIILKACLLLESGKISEHAFWDSIEAIKKTKATNSAAKFHVCLAGKVCGAGDEGMKKFNRLLAQTVIPEGLL